MRQQSGVSGGPFHSIGRPFIHSPKKSFRKKSYISYTVRRDILYTKAFSGVGLGAGLRFGV